MHDISLYCSKKCCFVVVVVCLFVCFVCFLCFFFCISFSFNTQTLDAIVLLLQQGTQSQTVKLFRLLGSAIVSAVIFPAYDTYVSTAPSAQPRASHLGFCPVLCAQLVEVCIFS